MFLSFVDAKLWALQKPTRISSVYLRIYPIINVYKRLAK